MKAQSSGFAYLIDGFQLIFKPGIRRFLIIPLLINIILFCGLFFVCRHLFSELTHWLTQYLPSWLQWLSGLLWIVFFIGFLLVIIYTFVTIANLIGAPFNSLLAEKVEFYLTGKNPKATSSLDTIKDIPRAIGRQFAILGYYLPRAVLLLILFFVPIIQIIAAPLWFVFNAWFMTLQCVDYPTDNHRIPLSTVKLQLKKKRVLSLSFGIGVLLLAMIPGVNFFIIPAAVAGATKLWIENF